MPHHKRRRPKNRRAGCLLCKPWKVNGYGKLAREREPHSDHRRRVFAVMAIRRELRGGVE